MSWPPWSGIQNQMREIEDKLKRSSISIERKRKDIKTLRAMVRGIEESKCRVL